MKPSRPSPADLQERVARFQRACLDDPLLAAVAARGQGVYLVGGSVRDVLLGVPSKDFDFTVASGACELARKIADDCGGSFVLLKEARGIARVARGGEFIDFADFQAPTLTDDLCARDLTINAMALHLDALRDGTAALIDPTGGRDDLCRGVLRCPRISVLGDDPLRVLRVARFACKLGFAIDDATRAGMAAFGGEVARVAGERVRDELFQILRTDLAHEGCALLDACGALSVLFPELEKMRGLEQGRFHHRDVFEHTMLALEAVDSAAIPSALSMLEDAAPLAAYLDRTLGATDHTVRACIRLGALLHDVGKPSARSLAEDGAVSYKMHEEIGGRMMPDIAARLKLSVPERALVTDMVRWHLEPLQMKSPKNLRPRHIRRYFAKISHGVETLIMALADSEASGGPKNTAKVRADLAERVRRMLRWYFSDAPSRCVPLLDGRTIGSILDLAPGRDIGRILDLLKDAQADGRVATREEALHWLPSVRTRIRPAGEEVAGQA